MKTLVTTIVLFFASISLASIKDLDVEMNFQDGESVAVCFWEKGEKAGVPSNKVDLICRGPFKVVGNESSNGTFVITNGIDSVEVRKDSLAKLVDSIYVYDSDNAQNTVTVGETRVVCRNANAGKKTDCLNLKVKNIAVQKRDDGYTGYVLFEGTNIWIYDFFLKDAHLYERAEGLFTSK